LLIVNNQWRVAQHLSLIKKNTASETLADKPWDSYFEATEQRFIGLIRIAKTYNQCQKK